jgi:hypothetical protein
MTAGLACIVLYGVLTVLFHGGARPIREFVATFREMLPTRFFKTRGSE